MRALLIPPQESKFRAVFDLRGVDLKLITSGWHRLVIAAPRRVFVFPRNDGEVDQLEREAEALPAAVDLPFAPQLHGRHLDQGISRYPFLEMTRVEGTPYELVAGELSFEIAARLLETLGRKIAQLHDRVAVPRHLAERPRQLDHPRVSDDWTRTETLAGPARRSAALLRPRHGSELERDWLQALAPVARMERTAIHGDISDGNVIVDEAMEASGLVDWDGLHRGHPLLDLDFGVDGYRISRWGERWVELRQRIWRAYAAERHAALPNWRSVNLFWSQRDAATVPAESDSSDVRLNRALDELSKATDIGRADEQ